MEKDRGTKVIAIIALVVAVVGVSIGFAAFTSSLTITPEIEVAPLNNLRVLFSSDRVEQNPPAGSSANEVIIPVGVDDSYCSLWRYSGSCPPADGFSATSASIDNTDVTAPKVTNLKATFVRPNERIDYEFYVRNDSPYTVYLTSVEFGGKECVPKTGTDPELARIACSNIRVYSYEFDLEEGVTYGELEVPRYGSIPIHLILEYESNGYYSDELNGGMDITLGDITFNFTSAVPDWYS